MITIFNGRKRTLGGQTSDVWAQIDVAFRDHIHVFKGARLGVFLAIALHADADGWAWPSYDLLARETGYGTDTIRRALADLCDLSVNGYRVLLRYQPQAEGGQFTSNRYLLFPSNQEVAEYERAGVRHLGSETGGGFDSLPSLENPTTVDRGGKIPLRQKPSTEKPTTKKNQLKQEQHAVAADLFTEQQNAHELLIGLGVDPAIARGLAKDCALADVMGWATYTRNAQGLDNPAAFVVARLKAGEPAPAPGRTVEQSERDRQRFISGEYAAYIQH